MKIFINIFFVMVMAVAVFCQEPDSTPTEKNPEKIFIEEIVLNVSALDRSGQFFAGVKKEDLVIMEDGRLHQANSVRKIPASVLIAMDTGGEIRQKKNITTTRQVAEELVLTLQPDSHIALMQFHDRPEMLSGWLNEADELKSIIRSRTNFGRRASFTEAMMQAINFFENAPTKNRHLILITDGIDSVANKEASAAMTKQVWSSGIIVHVVSYTQIEFEALKPQARIWRKGEHKPRRLPDEVMEAMAGSLPMKRQDAVDFLNRVYPPRLLSILTDVPFIGSRRSQLRALSAGHLQLSALAAFTGGTILLPETLAEMTEKAAIIARSINSQYVVTYEPRRPLKDVKIDEIRRIDVTSRNPEIQVYGTRSLVVFADLPD